MRNRPTSDSTCVSDRIAALTMTKVFPVCGFVFTGQSIQGLKVGRHVNLLIFQENDVGRPTKVIDSNSIDKFGDLAYDGSVYGMIPFLCMQEKEACELTNATFLQKAVSLVAIVAKVYAQF